MGLVFDRIFSAKLFQSKTKCVPSVDEAIGVGDRHSPAFINSPANKKLYSFRPRRLCQSEFSFGRGKRFWYRLAKTEGAIKPTGKRYARPVSNRPANADGVVDHASERAGLRAGETSVEQNQANVLTGETKQIHQALRIDLLSSTMCSLKNDLAGLTSVPAEVDNRRLILHQESVQISGPDCRVLVQFESVAAGSFFQSLENFASFFIHQNAAGIPWVR